MRSALKTAAIVAGTAIVTSLVSWPALTGQTRTGGIPRLNGKPDLNGLWQALNTANWDIQAHGAKPALAMRPGPGRAGARQGSDRLRRRRIDSRRSRGGGRR